MNLSFKSEANQKKFDSLGYVEVPLLSSEQADTLFELYEQTKTNHQIAAALHHTTTDTQNLDLIRLVDGKIKGLLVDELAKEITNFKPLAGCFHIKQPLPGSATGIHQDPTFVDETLYNSANVWVALHDIDANNGNLFFIPGSNRIKSLRTIPSSPTFYNEFADELPRLAQSVSLKKGSAVIFNNATIHGATDNVSGEIRLAATLLIAPTAADWKIYYKAENQSEQQIEEYDLDLETFIAMPKNGKPRREAFSQVITYSFPKLSLDRFKKIAQNGEAELNIWGKVKALFDLKFSR